MNRRRNIILVAILFLAIGFATVTTNLIINGNLLIGNNDDFVVIFTSAKLNGKKRNDFIDSDKTTITFETNTLTTMKDVETLEFEVTNTSRNYNANVVITCTPVEHEYVELTLPSEMTVEAGTSEKERIIARLKKVTSEEQKIEINCTLTATAEERDNLGKEYVAPFSKAGTMMVAVNDDDTQDSIWQYRDTITKVVFENEIQPHETSEDLIFDVSKNQDESVMAYLVPLSSLTEEEINAAFEEYVQEETGMTLEEYKNYVMNEFGESEEEFNSEIENWKNEMFPSTGYILYIQSETGVKANKDSSNLLYKFELLMDIKGLEYFDTSNVANMNGMFGYCMNLTTLDLSHFDTSKVIDMSSMFKESGIYKLDLSSFDTSKVIDMSYMFCRCQGIEKLDLSSFDTTNVINMSGIFSKCYNLTTLDVSRFDTSNVKDMSHMFEHCNHLNDLDISNFDTSNVTDMSEMFYQCMRLNDLDISNFDTSNVTDMHWMFGDCSRLTSLDVSNFDTSNVTSMENMFTSCYDLTDLYLGRFDINANNDRTVFKFCSITLRIHIQDIATKDWILNLSRNGTPDWNDENFVLEA